MEGLTHNTVPKAVAERMIGVNDYSFAESYDNCTVLQSDIVGYTALMSHESGCAYSLPPPPPRTSARTKASGASLVTLPTRPLHVPHPTGPRALRLRRPASLSMWVLNFVSEIFEEFDTLCDEYACDKIKTIGDAYVVCAGALTLDDPESPHPQGTAPQRVVRMALRMQEVVKRKSEEAQKEVGVRIGVHTGWTAGGNIGKIRPHFDIWGSGVTSTVKMEELGRKGFVHISDATHSLLGDLFDCSPRDLSEDLSEEDIEQANTTLTELGIKQTFFVHHAKLPGSNRVGFGAGPSRPPPRGSSVQAIAYLNSKISRVSKTVPKRLSCLTGAAAAPSRGSTGASTPTNPLRKGDSAPPSLSNKMPSVKELRAGELGDHGEVVVLEEQAELAGALDGGGGSGVGIGGGDGAIAEGGGTLDIAISIDEEDSWGAKSGKPRGSMVRKSLLAVADNGSAGLRGLKGSTRRLSKGVSQRLGVLSVQREDDLDDGGEAGAQYGVDYDSRKTKESWSQLTKEEKAASLELAHQLMGRVLSSRAIAIALVYPAFTMYDMVLWDALTSGPSIPLLIARALFSLILLVLALMLTTRVDAMSHGMLRLANIALVTVPAMGAFFCILFAPDNSTQYMFALSLFQIWTGYCTINLPTKEIAIWQILITVGLATAESLATEWESINNLVRPEWQPRPQAQGSSMSTVVVYMYLVVAQVLGIWYHRVSRHRVNRHAKQQVAGNRSLADSQRSLAECQKLLESVFPKAVFKRLQVESEQGSSLTACENFEDCTFLFAKIVGLNKLTAQESGVTPAKVIEILQLVFDRFDLLADLFLVQKVRKTVYESYMLAAGLPDKEMLEGQAARAHAVVSLAGVMVSMMEIINRQLSTKYGMPPSIQLSLQIGIHSGSAIAGIMGHKRFQYDLCGDDVNVAARMMGGSAPRCINVSETTYELIKHDFESIDRGERFVKGKGMMRQYFITGGASFQAAKAIEAPPSALRAASALFSKQQSRQLHRESLAAGKVSDRAGEEEPVDAAERHNISLTERQSHASL